MVVPFWRQRAFILVPLVEIAPNWIEPVSRLRVSELVQKLNCSGVSLDQVSDSG